MRKRQREQGPEEGLAEVLLERVKRRPRSDRLSPATVAAVKSFWEDNTRESPCKKHIRCNMEVR